MCFVREHGAQKFRQCIIYDCMMTNDCILIRDHASQCFFILFPLRLLARTIFLPWDSLSTSKPEKPVIFGFIKNEYRVTFSVDGSPIIISMRKKDLDGYL